MIKIENVKVVGLEEAIRGMRMPMLSLNLSDSVNCKYTACANCPNYDGLKCTYLEKHPYFDWGFAVGENDLTLMKKLAKGGPVHAKYRRMIVVYADITAPLYVWKEADKYQIGTVTNSTSTMHKIHSRDLTIDDFSHEHLTNVSPNYNENLLRLIIDRINANRKIFLAINDKEAWWQMIQLLPSSYNQLRTWMGNYEVLANIYHSRKDHKLDEWREFCKWIETLPYSEIITCKEE